MTKTTVQRGWSNNSKGVGNISKGGHSAGRWSETREDASCTMGQWNWMILLGYRRLQYIGEEPQAPASPVALGGKKPDLWAGPTSRRRRPSGL
jgi:hypothetical protein